MDKYRAQEALRAISRADGVVPMAFMRDAGIGRGALESLISRGAIHRVRKGWFAIPSADARIVSAVRRGGAVACVTALEVHGVWIAHPGTPHLLVPSGAKAPADQVCHRAPKGRPPSFCVEPIRDAVARAICCLPIAEAIAATDSALRLSGTLGWRFDRDDLLSVVSALPRRYRRVLDWVDPRADSGLESLVRVRLVSAGIHVTPQASIAGVGRVDLLVGDRLVIETDGKAHHLGAQFARDRRRDAELLRLGYRVLRLTWADVMHDWPRVEALILELVRRREHLGPLARPA